MSLCSLMVFFAGLIDSIYSSAIFFSELMCTQFINLSHTMATSLDPEQTEQLQKRIVTAEDLLDRAENFCTENLTGAKKLVTKIRAELRFLEKIKKGKIEFKDDHLNSTNLTSLEALVNVMEMINCKNAVLEPFHFFLDDKLISGEEKRTIAVDVVCENGTIWVKVISRNAKALLTAWEGCGGFGEKSIKTQAELYTSAAKSNPCEFQTPEIFFLFCKGVPGKIAKGLKKMGINVRGNVVDEFCENSEVFDQFFELNFEENTKISDKKLAVNLDVTALLALVSNLCNGSCNFKFDLPVLSEQAIEERRSPVLPKIENFMNGKTLYACETAVHSFNEIVGTIGGPNEKHRALAILKRIKVVPDQPSERTQLLHKTGKVNPRSKVIFGTGDSLKAVTVTANVGFVRAALQSGTKFNVFIHEARALTEMKEKFAKSLETTDESSIFSECCKPSTL